MQARLIEWTEIAPGVRHFVFEAPELRKLEFVPGQFVSLSDVVKGKTITRAYSIASAPSESNRFELCLNRVGEGAFSPHLFDLVPGDTVEMRPPLGTFVLRDPPRSAVMVATGTGIAPFRSMLYATLQTAPPPAPSSDRDDSSPQFHLLFGVRHASHLLYRDEFEDLASQHPQFQFWPTLSRPDSSWLGRSGRVQVHLDEAIRGRRDIDVYLCGLKDMVDDLRRILKEKGFDRKQIRYEKYD